LRLGAMLDARHEAFDPHDDLMPDPRPPGRRSFGAGGASASYHLAALALDLCATGRLEATSDQISPTNPFGRTPAQGQASRELLPLGRLGAVAEPLAGLRVRANAGRYARVPSLFE